MPSRHNAAIKLTYHEDEKPFNIFLSSFGSPDSVKSLVKLSMRAKRRQIMLDPELLVVNLFERCAKTTQVYITRREKPAFTYHIDLLPKIPTVRIISHITNSADEFTLFEWIGPDYRISKKPIKLKTAPGEAKRRGRPSALSKDNRLSQHYVRAPLYIREDGTPVFDENK